MDTARRFFLLFLLYSAFVLHASAQEDQRTRTIIPGVVHTTYFKPGPYVVNVLEIDLREPAISTESYHSRGLVRTSDQVQTNNQPERRVIGAINADFFSFQTGWPLGNQVVNGKVIHGVPAVRAHLGFDIRRRPHIAQLSFHGSIRSKRGSVFRIDRVNEPRVNQRVILYTTEWDTTITQLSDDAVVVSRIVNSRWLIGDTLKAVVVSNTVSSTTVLGYHEAAVLVADQEIKTAFTKGVQVGDTISLFLDFESHLPDILEAVGGGGWILENGVYDSTKIRTSERLASDFLARRHPRTFVGFDRDTTKLFFCTVDGRQEASIGMNFEEMADFLRSIGAWNAINLDGGGSTTMVLEGAIVNSPSDKTGERPVANSLQVIYQTSKTGDKKKE